MHTLTGLVISLLALILFVSVSFGVQAASNITTFEIHVLGSDQIPEQSMISIQVPDRIYLGEVSVGGQTSDVKVDINNTGNVPIIVTPRLAASHQAIFDNLYFKRILSEPYYKIGNYSHSISAPSSSNVRTSYMYAKLDLHNYTDTFDPGSVNVLTSDVEFRVVAQ